MNTNYLVSTLAGTGTSSSSSPSSSTSSELSKPAPRNPHKIDSFLNNGQQQSAKMIPTAQMQNQFMPGGAQVTQPQVNNQASSMLPPHPMAGVYAPAQMQPGAYQPYPYPYYANQQGGFYGGAYGMPPPPPPPQPHLVQAQNGQPYGQMPFGHGEPSAPISHNINDLLKPSPAKSPNGANSSPPNAKTNGPGTPKGKKQKADKQNKKSNVNTNGNGNGTSLNGSDDNRVSTSSPHVDESSNELNKSNTKKASKPRAKKDKQNTSAETVAQQENSNSNSIYSSSSPTSTKPNELASELSKLNDTIEKSLLNSNSNSEELTKTPTKTNQSKPNKAKLNKSASKKSSTTVSSSSSSNSSNSTSSSSSSVASDDSNDRTLAHKSSSKKSSNGEERDTKPVDESSSNSNSSATSSSSSSNKKTAPSPISFNISNILSSNTNPASANRPPSQPNMQLCSAEQSLFHQSQMLPPPSPSNGSTSSSSSSTSSQPLSKAAATTITNAASPSAISSSSSSSAQQQQPYYNKPMQSAPTSQSWKPSAALYPSESAQVKRVPSADLAMSERPPAAQTPINNENSRPVQPQTPTTPTLGSATPRSPIVQHASTSMPYTTDNSNMSFSQDHDDDTSMSNSDEPSCSSPKLGGGGTISTKSAAHNAEILAKVVEMGNGADEPRKEFVSRLQKLWEEYNIVCRNLPNISKQPLDLFKLYVMVKEKGGFNEVTKNKAWKDVSAALSLGPSASAALNLRKKYVSLGVFHYECRHDLNNTDPLPMIAEMERSAQSAKKESSSGKSKANTSSGNTNDSLTQPSTPSTPNPNASSLTGSAKKKKKEKNNAVTSTTTPAVNTNVNNITNTSSPSVVNPQQHQIMQQQQQQPINQMGYGAQVQPQQQPQPIMHPHPQLMQQQQQHYNPEYAQQQPQQPVQQYPQGYAPNAGFYAQSRPAYAGYQQYPPQANMVAGYPPAQQAQPQPQPPQQQPQQIQRIYNPAAADMMQYNQQQPVRYPAPPQQANPAPNLPLQQQTQTPSQPQPQQQQPHYPMMNYQYQPSPYAHAPYAPPQQQQQPQQQHNAAGISKDRSSSVDDMSKLNQPGTPVANSVLASKLAMSNSQGVTPQTPNAIRQQQQQPQPHHGHHHGHHHHHHHSKPVTPQLQLQQQQAQPHQQLMSQSLHIGAQLPLQLQMKKEIVFPPDSVEATIPVETKKRKIGAREIAPCDPWKLYISLKSGLLAESTAALDALNILLYDDNTIAYFHLKHLPGLVKILMEHFLKCLKLIFGKENGAEFDDIFLNDYPYELDEDEYEEFYANYQNKNNNNNDSFDTENDSDLSDFEHDSAKKNDSTQTNHIYKAKGKQLNGFSNNHHADDSSSSTASYESSNRPTRSTRHTKPKTEPKLSNGNNNNNPSSHMDKFKILKISFNDKETRNRFMHYNKAFKFNDSKQCAYWASYNKKILSKFDETSTTKRTKTNTPPDKDSAEYKQALEQFKREKKELNNFILTSFSSQDELDTLNQVYYGPYYKPKLKQPVLKQTTKAKPNKVDKLLETVLSSKVINVNSESELKSLNEDFIKKHQLKSEPDSSSSYKPIKKPYDDQTVTNEESVFKIVNQSHTDLINRCVCLSTIFRNLSFIPGNDVELCKYNLLLKILARLLILKHSHNIFIPKNSEYEQNELEDDNSEPDINQHEYLDEEFECIKELNNKSLLYKVKNKTRRASESSEEWWWECVSTLRENTLVTVANLAGAINLNGLDEDVIELYAHGLVHWAICKSNDAQDALPTIADTSLISPQRLAIEALSKMTINEINVDLILATISNMRPYLNMLISLLSAEWLVKRDDETLREFAIVLLTAMAKCDQFAARLIAKYASHLITFIEEFEEQTRRIALTHPNASIFQNPQVYDSNINDEHLGTTIDMIRRCSSCIMYLAVYAENIPHIMKHEHRLLDLTTSQYVDFKVVQTLAEVLFYCSSSASNF